MVSGVISPNAPAHEIYLQTEALVDDMLMHAVPNCGSLFEVISLLESGRL